MASLTVAPPTADNVSLASTAGVFSVKAGGVTRAKIATGVAPFVVCGGCDYTAGSARYFMPGMWQSDTIAPPTVEAQRQVPFGASTLRKFTVRCHQNDFATSYTFTVRKNGVDTGLTLVFAAADDLTTKTVSADVALAEGDLLTISGTPVGTSALIRASWSLWGDN